jgi:hypothetical protein
VRHRLGRDDFARTGELHHRHAPDVRYWKVCQGYELQPSPETTSYKDRSDHTDCLIKPKYSANQEDRWHSYNPFEDTPDLFLKFARLYEPGKGASVDAILNWVHGYGLLGYSEGRYYGGPEESVEQYRASIYWAAGILAMYEAALNGDEDAAKDVVLREFLSVGPSSSLLQKLGEQEFTAYQAETVEQLWGGSYIAYALENALDLVTVIVQAECRPTLYLPEGCSDPSQVTSGWGFSSLYAVIYLQMYFLMAAGVNITRCKYCGRIISLASLQSGTRKTREDKKFCGNACRQRHHYHTKTKPRRQRDEA